MKWSLSHHFLRAVMMNAATARASKVPPTPNVTPAINFHCSFDDEPEGGD